MRDLKDNPEPGRYTIHPLIPEEREHWPKIGDKISLEVLTASPSESLVVRITEILDKGENFRGIVENDSGCYNVGESIPFPMKKIFGIMR